MLLGTLAPVPSASYPILARQPTVSFHASFGRSLALPPLRFPLVVMVYFQEDFHLKVSAHAGRTKRERSTLSLRLVLYFMSVDMRAMGERKADARARACTARRRASRCTPPSWPLSRATRCSYGHRHFVV